MPSNCSLYQKNAVQLFPVSEECRPIVPLSEECRQILNLNSGIHGSVLVDKYIVQWNLL